MKKTVSQKIARLFEIAGYLWLLPSVISLFYPVLFSIALVFSGGPDAVFLLLIPLAIFGAGVFLLVQYYRHSRGSLGDDFVIPLWAGTLVFNSLLLVPFAYGLFGIFNAIDKLARPLDDWQQIAVFGWGLVTFWLAAAVLLSMTAIISELKNQKYR
ncbi:MAG TPA: hypothetical protein VF599_05835 [Pyrinomonadaceae bacterium]